MSALHGGVVWWLWWRELLQGETHRGGPGVCDVGVKRRDEPRNAAVGVDGRVGGVEWGCSSGEGHAASLCGVRGEVGVCGDPGAMVVEEGREFLYLRAG